jgi:NTE family protein
VSDGGGSILDEPTPKRDQAEHMYRVLRLLDSQVRSLRKRQVIDFYRLGLRKGTYWGIRSNILDYKLPTAMNCPFDRTQELANTATRLTQLDKTLQEQIINWGYGICDAAIRTHLDQTLKPPSSFPYPDSGV